MKLFDYPVARERMVREQLVSNGIVDPRVLGVMRQIPRHIFLGRDMGSEAYSDHSYPIGYSQTMSQPYMVAYLAEQLALDGEETILEIGTGSGYQAAVLSRLVRQVYTVERIAPLAEKARNVLDSLGIRNVQVSIGDGSHGWADRAPFDRILTTAAATAAQTSLLEQLRDGGFFLGPVFSGADEQEIVRLTRTGRNFRLERLRKCSFVPLVPGRWGETAVERRDPGGLL